MVNVDDKLAKIRELVDNGKYFTINRARQFGKTTTMDLLYKKLKNVYKFIYISFECDSVETWQTTESFCSSLIGKFLEELTQSEDYDYWKSCRDAVKSLEDLSSAISRFCEKSELPVIVMIDEVDKSQDNQIFLCFLGMLRNKYLKRTRENSHSTFHSVILAGVYDVKNLKLKIRSDEEKKYNSPWNIAVRFNVDMTLGAEGIKGMLDEYESDYHTGMDTKIIADEIYRMTSGYPFLVSFVCSLIHEEFCGDWSDDGVKKAIKWIVVNNSTLMDDLSKNLENNSELKRMLEGILLHDKEYLFEPDVPAIRLGNMFSFIKNDETGHVAIHNLIFEQKLYNYFMAEQSLKEEISFSTNRSIFVSGGKLNMPLVIERFEDM